MSGTITLNIDGKPVKVRWGGSAPPTRDDVSDIETDYRSRRKGVAVAQSGVDALSGMFGGKRTSPAASPFVYEGREKAATKPVKATPVPKAAPQAFPGLGAPVTAESLLTPPPKRNLAKEFPKQTAKQKQNEQTYNVAKQVAVSKGTTPPPVPTSETEMGAVIDFIRGGNRQADVTETAREMALAPKGNSFQTNDPMAGKSIEESQAAMTQKVMRSLGMDENNVIGQMVAGWIPSIMAEVAVLGDEKRSIGQKAGAVANIGLNTIVGPEIVAGKALSRLSGALKRMGKDEASALMHGLSQPVQTFLKSQRVDDKVARSFGKKLLDTDDKDNVIKFIRGESPVSTNVTGDMPGVEFRTNTRMGEVTPGHREAARLTGKPLTTNDTAVDDFQRTIDQLKSKADEYDPMADTDAVSPETRMNQVARFLADPSPDSDLLVPNGAFYDRQLDHAIQKAYGEKNPVDGGASDVMARRYEQQTRSDMGREVALEDRALRDILKNHEKVASDYVRWYKRDGVWRPDSRRSVLGVYLHELPTELQSKLVQAAEDFSGNDTLRFVPGDMSMNARKSSKAGGVATWDTPPPGAKTPHELVTNQGDLGAKSTFVPTDVIRRVLGDLDVDPDIMDVIAREMGMVTDDAAVKVIKDVADIPEPKARTTAHADVDEVRTELGWKARDESPETVESWVNDAATHRGKELAIAEQLDKSPRQLTKSEEIAIGQRFKATLDERKAAADSGDMGAYDRLDLEAQKLAKALDVSGSEWGRQGVARQIMIADDFSEFGIRRKWQKAALRELTDAEKQDARILAEQLQAATDEVAKLQRVNIGLEEYILAKGKEIPSKGRKINRADIRDRRAAAINDLVNKWRDNAPEPGMRSDPLGAMTAIETAQRFAAVAPDILKIAKTYVDEGIMVIEDVIAKVRGHLPEDMIMTDDELRAVLAGKVKAKQDAATVKSDWESFKDNAARHFQNAKAKLDEADRLAKAEKRKADKSARAEQRAAERAFWADVKESEMAFQKGQRAKRATERAEYRKWWATSEGGQTASLMNQMTKLERKIQSLDAGTWEAASKAELSPELLEMQMKRDTLRRIAKQKELELTPQKRGALGEVAGALRTTLSTGDFSQPMTQGALFGMMHPIQWLRSFKKVGKATFSSEAGYQRMVSELQQSPDWDLIEASGVDLPSMGGKKDGEFFFDTAMQKVPVLGNVMKGSQQGFDIGNTATRVMLMDSWIDILRASGRPMDKEQLKMLGEAANILTGKGTGGMAEAASKGELSRALFAPSWWISQYQAVTGKPLRLAIAYGRSSGNYAPLRLMAKEYSKLVGGTMAILYGVDEALAQLNQDWRVERDPRSSLFGKMWANRDGRIVSFDLLPMQISGPIKQMAMIAPGGGVLEKDGQVTSDPYTRALKVGQTLLGKQAPLPKNVYDVTDSMRVNDTGKGKHPFGRNKDPRTAEGLKGLGFGQLPIGWQQFWESRGAPLSAAEKAIIGVLSFGGRGVNDYATEDPVTRDTRKKMF